MIPPNGQWSGNFVRVQLRAGTLRRVSFAARLIPLAEAAGAAFAVYALGAELFGPVAGALAGLLWLASPWSWVWATSMAPMSPSRWP